MSETSSRSPMKRMRSLRLKKNRNTLKQNEVQSITPRDTKKEMPDTSSVTWSRNPDAAGTLLNEVQNDLNPSQMNSLGLSLAATENSLDSPRLRKGPKKSPKASTKSTRFFKLPTRSKTPEKSTHHQQIDLREIEICQQIGRGASSAGVFLCLVDGWACAMKQLKKEHVGAIDIRCFEREMDILYQLPPHPSIVRYLFHTSLGTDLCLFMQLYSGTLREHLDERRKTNRAMPPDKIAQIALEAARGIQFLHQHGVIHRDIKAGNVFVTKNEEGEVTRIAIGDFDTSLRVSASLRNIKENANGDMIMRDESNEPSGNIPRNGGRQTTAEKRNYFSQYRPKSTVGTAGFMAPEVLRSRGAKPYGFKADIYSFGMLLYEMLTLKLPYETLDTMDIIDAVLEGTQVESMKISQSLKDRYLFLVDLYIMCTSMKPEERPSIGKIIKQLTPIVDRGEFILKVERKPSFIEQLNKYNNNTSVSVVDREPNLLMEMDSAIAEATGISIPTPVVKFGGPQTQNLDSARKYPAPLGVDTSRDEIQHTDDDVTLEEPTEDSKMETSESRAKMLQRSMSKFGGVIDPRKKRKREGKKEKKKSDKRKHRKGDPSEQNEPLQDSGTISLKRPKRNTISKSQLQRMVDGKLEYYDPDTP